MTEEAREAAARAFPSTSFGGRERVPVIERGAFESGYDAGVAEGIRQAREAVAELHRGGTSRGDDYTQDALDAIDSLEPE